ncbi:hypothetical protein [Dysgonomonas alginatilytica]|nr:hypothetical protein [Dysgonomonas alginatilytica]
MKTKTILTVISLTAFLFTSCEKDEIDMDQGIGSGGGMGKATDPPIITLDSDTTINYYDSLKI